MKKIKQHANSKSQSESQSKSTYTRKGKRNSNTRPKSKSKVKHVAQTVVASAATVALAFACAGIGNDLTTRRYQLFSSKISSPVRFVLLADLHNCLYGQEQEQLLAAINSEKPDFILMAGDMFDSEINEDGFKLLLEGLNGNFPFYYVTGNHEIRDGISYKIKSLIKRNNGVTLSNDNISISVHGNELNICGLENPTKKTLGAQLSKAFRLIDQCAYTILLVHRPELFRRYMTKPCDLIVSGHTHGGQWRIPKLLNGLFAPDQGLFPKCAGGLYTYNSDDRTLTLKPDGEVHAHSEAVSTAETQAEANANLGDDIQAGPNASNEKNIIVSRGLAKETTIIPRIYNDPELVVVELLPVPTDSADNSDDIA